MSEIQIRLAGSEKGILNYVVVSLQVVVSSSSVEILYSMPALDYLAS